MHEVNIHISALTDEQLAQAADEYIERTIKRARDNGLKTKIRIAVACDQYDPDSAYTISHGVSIDTDIYAPLIKSGNNLSTLDIAFKREEEAQIIAPVTRVLQIEQQEAVVVADMDDDYSF